MKRVCKLAGIVSKPVQRRYIMATEKEREAMRPVIDRESGWMIEKMARKGYQLEATVGDVYGLFTRGPARGSVRLQKNMEVSAIQ